MNLRYKKMVLASIAALSGFAANTQAAPSFTFNPNNHELLLNFRQAGKDDVIVDIGAASLYTKNNGSIITITTVTADNLLTGAGYSSLANIKWSVSGYVTPGSATPSEPNSTIWATKTTSTPFNKASGSLQNISGSNMKAVGDTANSQGFRLSDQVATLPQSAAVNYTKKVGSGNFGGNSLSAGVEGNTGAAFTYGNTSKLYFHQMVPGSGAGTLEGYFLLENTSADALHPSMSMKYFTAGVPPVAVPEPSTYGAIAGGLMLGMTGLNAMRNRKKA